MSATFGAIESVLGAHAKIDPPQKSVAAHMLGAAGSVEPAVSALAIHHRRSNLKNTDPDCAWTCPTKRELAVDSVMSNSFGFGGTNASWMSELGTRRRSNTHGHCSMDNS